VAEVFDIGHTAAAEGAEEPAKREVEGHGTTGCGGGMETEDESGGDSDEETDMEEEGDDGDDGDDEEQQDEEEDEEGDDMAEWAALLREHAELDCMVTVVDAANFHRDFAGSSESLQDRGMAAGEGDTRAVSELLVQQVS
jgi:hypothetical protein